MLLRSIRTKTAIIFLSLCVSSCYPLSETAALKWAMTLGLIPGAAAGVGTGAFINNMNGLAVKFDPNTAKWVAGIGVGAGTWTLSSYLIYQILYQYTPKPTIEYAKKTVKQISTNSEYAKDFLTLSQDNLLKQLSTTFGRKTTMEYVLTQFNGFIDELEKVNQRLDNIKTDLDSKDLTKSYEKIKNKANTLTSYLNIRFALIAVAFATTDQLLNHEFRSYSEFGTNGQPSIREAIGYFEKMSVNLSSAQRSLSDLTATQNSNPELSNSFYSFNEIVKAAKLLKSISDLRLAQAEAFFKEQSFASDSILNRYFKNERDLTDYLNAHSQTSWPLVIAKQNLNTELAKCNTACQSASKILNAFDYSQPEYRRQSAEVLEKIQTFTNIVETNLKFVAQSRDYFNQVRLYEEHLERERQRKLEQERFERQQALEKERLAEENRRHWERLAHDAQMQREKQHQEDKLAKERKKHEKDLLDQKLAHEKELQQAKLNKQNDGSQTQPAYTPPPAYNPFANASAPAYQAPSQYDPNYVEPSAPPAPIDYSSDQPPAYEDLFPTPSAPSYEAVHNTPAYTTYGDTSSQQKHEQLPPPPSYESLYPAK